MPKVTVKISLPQETQEMYKNTEKTRCINKYTAGNEEKGTKTSRTPNQITLNFQAKKRVNGKFQFQFFGGFWR